MGSTTLNSNNVIVFHQYLYNGLYDVQLLASDFSANCEDSVISTDYIFCSGGDDNPNGINDLDLVGFTIIPNPSSGSFTLSMENENSNEILTLDIFNSIGQLVHSEIINNPSRSLRKQVSWIWLKDYIRLDY